VVVGDVVRQGAPLAARLIQIEERVEDLASDDGARAPGVARRRQQRGDHRPLRIGQIGWVCCSVHASIIAHIWVCRQALDERALFSLRYTVFYSTPSDFLGKAKQDPW